MNKPIINKPIFVTGCARSGTSLLAGIICHAGAFGGSMIGATRANPRGQFENLAIRDLTKQYLRERNWDPLGQDPLPDIDVVKRDAQNSQITTLWRREIKRALGNQGYDGISRWFYKGAKLCLLWPIFNEMFPEATWVVTKRDMRSIANSCMNTSFMKAFHSIDGWEMWVNEHFRRFDEMDSEIDNISFLETGKIVSGDYTDLELFLRDMDGLVYDREKITGFVSKQLWHFGG